MKTNFNQDRTVIEAAIVALIILTVVMLLALFTRTPPHPPLEVPLFSLAPFLGGALAFGAASLLLARSGHVYAKPMIILFCMFTLVSFGPQKYFDPSFSRIWPAVICAQISMLTIFMQIFSRKPNS